MIVNDPIEFHFSNFVLNKFGEFFHKKKHNQIPQILSEVKQ